MNFPLSGVLSSSGELNIDNDNGNGGVGGGELSSWTSTDVDFSLPMGTPWNAI